MLNGSSGVVGVIGVELSGFGGVVIGPVEGIGVGVVVVVVEVSVVGGGSVEVEESVVGGGGDRGGWRRSSRLRNS